MALWRQNARDAFPIACSNVVQALRCYLGASNRLLAHRIKLDKLEFKLFSRPADSRDIIGRSREGVH